MLSIQSNILMITSTIHYTETKTPPLLFRNGVNSSSIGTPLIGIYCKGKIYIKFTKTLIKYYLKRQAILLIAFVLFGLFTNGTYKLTGRYSSDGLLTDYKEN